MPTPLLRGAELRQLETRHAKITPPLMERAGRAAARFALERFGTGRVLVCAGPGNNGGDGLIMARELAQAGAKVTVLFSADPARLPPDAAAAYASCRQRNIDITGEVSDASFALVVDALFGIGLTRPVDGTYAEMIGRINAFEGPVLALDVPSGIDGDSGRVLGPAVRATHTLSFIGGKPGLYTLDGPDHAGEVVTTSLDLDLVGFPGALLALEDFAGSLRRRRRNSHKGSYGSLAVIGGAPGMAGAALLAGRAALQLGAGRVFVGQLERIAVDPAQPELMLRAPGDALALATTVVAGPGLGMGSDASDFLRQVVAGDLPLLLDADALNLVAAHPVIATRLSRRHAATLLTPHPTEAARLLGCSTEEVQHDRVDAALRLANRFNALVALKGCGTVVATPDGRWRINASGNPGLASAGTGDVLAGMAGALLAQGWPAFAALCGAVHVHGLAADLLVAGDDGPIGIAASELIPAARTLLNRLIAANA